MTGFTPLVMPPPPPVIRSPAACSSHAGAMLGASAVHVVRTLGMEHTAFDLVFARDLFDSEELVDAVESVRAPIAPGVRLERLDVPPVIGAALLAVELAGDTPSTEARATLASGLAPALATR